MKICARCQKTARTATQRSHSMIATKRRQKPNLQRGLFDGRRAWLCTRCLGVMRPDPEQKVKPEAQH